MRVLIPLLLAAASSTALADSCAFSAARNVGVDAAGLKTALFRLGANDLELEGVPGLSRIEIRGRACASDQAALDGLSVSQARAGDRLTVGVEDAARPGGWFGSRYAYIDLTARVPAELLAEIVAGSGDAEVRRVAALTFTSGSGDLEARDVAGQVAVEVGSGDAELDTIGALTLRSSGSGDLRAKRVRGGVEVGRVGSGDLTFEDVAGDVRIERVGSGDVEVRDVGGSVSVGAIGSGDVIARGIRGDLTVQSQRSGSVQHSDVGGRVSVPESR